MQHREELNYVLRAQSLSGWVPDTPIVIECYPQASEYSHSFYSRVVIDSIVAQSTCAPCAPCGRLKR